MNKKVGILISIFCAAVLLTGCQQEKLSTEPASQKEKEARGYVEKLVETNKNSKEKIGDAVDMQNQKNEEAMKVLEDDNSQSTQTMNNVPEQINMEFAQTCKGAVITTNKGDIEIEFYNDKAPVTVANFCTLADKGFYDNVIFHRVIKDFMIQGGDPDGTGMGGPGYKFDDEIHTNNKNNVGTIAMANAGPGTNGSQFFINTKANNFLDTKHTVFGEVVSGMETVTAIEDVETGAQDRPVSEVVIESVELDM